MDLVLAVSYHVGVAGLDGAADQERYWGATLYGIIKSS